MKISKVAIKNYRCIGQVEFDVNNYTAFIGANGSGKSSILYALSWFFGARPIAKEDKNKRLTEQHGSVSVTFKDLNQRDRGILRQFGRKPTVCLTRSVDYNSLEESFTGAAVVGLPLEPVYGSVSNLNSLRGSYRRARDAHQDLPDLGTSPQKDEILRALFNWECDPANHQHLVDRQTDATAMVKGSMSEAVKFVFVPGSADLAAQVGSDSRGSVFTSLTSAMLSSAVSSAENKWKADHQAELEDLKNETLSQITLEAEAQSARVTAELQSYLPGAEVTFEPVMSDWTFRNDASLQPIFKFDGQEGRITEQGHGTQRALMMSMVQSLADNSPDGNGDRPLLVLAVEEPEIYQHPVRARHFARSLTAVSEQEHSQVLLATHSPYFIRPEQFNSLRRVRMDSYLTLVKSTSSAALAAHLQRGEDEVLKRVAKELPRTFSEGFFSDFVVMVEGDTDRVVLEIIAEKMGLPLDSAGISVISYEGKDSLPLSFPLLTSLETKAYVVIDGDFLGAKRKHPANAAKEAASHASHKLSTETCLVAVPPIDRFGSPVTYQFGDPTKIAANVTILHDCIEHELESWPSYVAAVNAGSGRIFDKNAYTYRSAAHAADAADIPQNLQDLINEVRIFAGC